MWSAAVRLKPDTAYGRRGPAEAGHLRTEHVAQHVAPVELASLDLASRISSKARSSRTTLRPTIGRSVTTFDHA